MEDSGRGGEGGRDGQWEGVGGREGRTVGRGGGEWRRELN